MTFDIDMTQESGGEMLAGVNLWTVTSASVERSKSSGMPMLVLKMRCGGVEMTDRAMLDGGGRDIGRRKLLALGVPPTFKGRLDETEFIGRKVWAATIVKSETWQGKDGTPKTGRKMEVDINQLEHAGYQAEANLPPGASLPADVDETPF